MKLRKIRDQIWQIEDILPAVKCENLIQETESRGYQPATINTDAGARTVSAVRNNLRVMYIDQPLADELWGLLKPHAPNQYGQSVSVGLNEMFRFYKYEPGQKFRKHRDESFIRNDTEASYFTVLLYLNDEFVGGETRFQDIEVKPKLGSALIFAHMIEHEGAEILSGKKYVLRTDIMFRLKPMA